MAAGTLQRESKTLNELMVSLSQYRSGASAGVCPVGAQRDASSELVVCKESRVLYPGDGGGVQRLDQSREALSGRELRGFIQDRLEDPFGLVESNRPSGSIGGCRAENDGLALFEFDGENYWRAAAIDTESVEPTQGLA
jgi:hypothetical protein